MSQPLRRQALRAAVAMALALAVLLMHTQIASAATVGVMEMPHARPMPAATSPANMSPQDADGLISLPSSHLVPAAAGRQPTGSWAALTPGTGDPTPGPGGCAGHTSICSATVAADSVTVLPPTACRMDSPVDPSSDLTTGLWQRAAQKAPDPPTPEQPLLQVWRC